MIPSSIVGFLVFLVAVAPGYVFQRLVERRIVRYERSAWLQAVDLLCIGATCTVVGGGIVLLGGEAWPQIFVDLQTLVSGPVSLAERPWRFMLSAITALLLSSAVATGFALLAIRFAGREGRFGPGSIWSATFSKFQRPVDGTNRAAAPIYLVLQLNDGRTLGGQLAFGDTGVEPDKRDIALAAPLWMTEPGSRDRELIPYDFAIVKNADISVLLGKTLKLNTAPRDKGPAAVPHD